MRRRPLLMCDRMKAQWSEIPMAGDAVGAVAPGVVIFDPAAPGPPVFVTIRRIPTPFPQFPWIGRDTTGSGVMPSPVKSRLSDTTGSHGRAEPKAHNLKVAGSNPAPASKEKPRRPMAYGASSSQRQPTAHRAFPHGSHKQAKKKAPGPPPGGCLLAFRLPTLRLAAPSCQGRADRRRGAPSRDPRSSGTARRLQCRPGSRSAPGRLRAARCSGRR